MLSQERGVAVVHAPGVAAGRALALGEVLMIRFMAAPAVSFQGPGRGVATADDSANAGTCASRLTCHRGHGAAIPPLPEVRA